MISSSSSSSSSMLRDCDSCRSAPCVVYCQADAAALCAACDADIHSANPISRSHHRVSLLPITCEADDEENEAVAASWLLVNPVEDGDKSSNGFLFGGEVDKYLNLVEFNSCTEDMKPNLKTDGGKNEGSEFVVPVQCVAAKEEQQQKDYEMEYQVPNAGFSYSDSLSPCVYHSSMESSSIVPENTVTDVSSSHTRPLKGTIELFSSPPLQMQTQFSPMDREARVLRYREKRKTRKFEKTIRYASRKAYAEARPRIKGRFAKRTDVEVEVDQMFSNYVITDDSYGIVPSF